MAGSDAPTTDIGDWGSRQLAQTRRRLWRAYAIVAAVIFPLAFPLTFEVLWNRHHHGLIALDAAAWIYAVAVSVRPWGTPRVRAIMLVALLYALLVSFLVALGPGGARPGWCVFVPVTAALMIGLRAGLACVVANAALLVGLRWWYGPFFSAGGLSGDAQGWAMLVVNLSGLSVAAVAAVSFMVSRLDEAVRREGEMRRELARAQRLEAVGRVARGVAHDLGNMIQPIAAYTRLLERSLDGEGKPAQYVRELSDAARRIGVLVNQVLAYGREPTATSARAALGDVVNRLERQVAPTLAGGVALAVDCRATADDVAASEASLYQVLLNLVTNAVSAVGTEGRVTIATRDANPDELPAVLDPDVRYVVASVTDDGPGMDAETAARVFEPLFTTKGEGGSGLGLETASGIVMALGGRVGLETAPGEGAVFRVYLPLAGIRQS